MGNIIKYNNISRLGKYFRLSEKPPIFEKGEKEFLYDQYNKMYLDFACGSGTTFLGHNIEYFKKGFNNVLNKGIIHTGPHFVSSIHIKYFKKLNIFFKKKFNIFNLATNGSEATEIALKLAFQNTNKKKIIYFDGSYHGRTGYSLLSSDMKGLNKRFFISKNFIKCKFNNINDFKKIFNKHKKDLAAVIIEPIQATSGFNFVDRKFLKIVSNAIKKNSSLLIFDEVWTGFGKTGYNFAFEYYKQTPDILILGKSLGGGLPLGLIAFKNTLNHKFPGVQSSTFQGNILSINNSHLFLNYLKKYNYLKKVRYIEHFFKEYINIFNKYEFVEEFRGVGSMWGIEIKNSRQYRDLTNKIRSNLLNDGLITWECGKNSNVIGLVPPICISIKSLKMATNIIFNTFDEVLKTRHK